MSDEIKAGDIVRLKSGGPDMTVKAADANDVWVIWFYDGKIHQDSFPLVSVERA